MASRSVAVYRSSAALSQASTQQSSRALLESSFCPALQTAFTSRRHEVGSRAFREKKHQMQAAAKLGVSESAWNGRGSVKTKFASDHACDRTAWEDELRRRDEEGVSATRKTPYIAEAAVGMVVCSARGCRPIFEAAASGEAMESKIWEGGVCVQQKTVEDLGARKKKPAYPDGFVDYLNEVWMEKDVAQRLFEKELQQNPRSAKVLASYAAFAYKEQNDVKLAERLYRQALQEAPEDADLLSSYALFLWQTEV